MLPYILPIALVLAGGVLLTLGFWQGQDLRVLAGAGLALVAGVISILVLRGAIGNRSGMVLGIVFSIFALGLAYINYRSVHITEDPDVELSDPTSGGDRTSLLVPVLHSSSYMRVA